jgi:hypothetical protein
MPLTKGVTISPENQDRTGDGGHRTRKNKLVIGFEDREEIELA